MQLSIKFGSNGSGYAIVEAASTEALVEEAGKLMDQAGFVNAVVEEIQARATLAQAGMTTEQVPTPYPGPVQQPGTPAGPSTGNCAHGVPWRYKEGIGSNGQPYKVYYCTQRNDPGVPQCKSKFLN